MNCIVFIFFYVNLICNIYSVTYDYGSFHNYENYDYYDNNDISKEESGIDNETLLLTTPKIITASIGETVLLPCEVNSHDHVVRIWKKGDSLLYQENVKLSGLNDSNINILKNASLEVKIQSKKDMNEYTCQIWSTQGNYLNVTHRITLRHDDGDAPLLMSTPKVFEVNVGETVFLPCEVSNPTSHKIRHFVRLWKRGEISLLYGDNFKVFNENINVLPQGILKVNTESEIDTNTYTCEIKSEQDLQRVSHQVVVFPTLSTESKIFEVNFGETIELPCDVYYKNEMFSVNTDKMIRTWMKGQMLLYHGKSKFAGENTNLLYDGALMIRIDSYEDLDVYSCSIISAGGKIDKVTHTVVAKHRILPKLITKPQIIITNVGETVSLPCEISYPYENVVKTWIRGENDHSDKLLGNEENVKYPNGTLKLKIKKDDNLAEYSCIIKTSGKSEVQRITHRIKLRSASTQHIISSLLILILYVCINLL